MVDRKLNVLVACEESGRVCAEFRKLGHTAFSCDILPTSGGHPEWHVQGDCLPLLNGEPQEFTTEDEKKHRISGKWDFIMAHPPCTYLAASSGCRLWRNGVFSEERYNKGLEAKEFFLACLNANCEHVCVENPTQLTIFKLPKCTQVIQPWMWGENYMKRTCLWQRNVPKLIPDIAEKPEGVKKWVAAGNLKPDGTRREDVGYCRNAKIRSKTFYGIARAIATQYSAYLLTLPPSNTTVEDIP